MLDGIAKAFTLGAIALVILGLFDVNSYYARFGVPINDFLSPSEMILSFSQLNFYSFFHLVAFSIMAFLNIYISIARSKGLDRINKEDIGNIENTNYSKTNPKFIKLIFYDILLIVLFLVSGLFHYNMTVKHDHYDSMLIAQMFFLFWVTFYRLLEMSLFWYFEIKDKYYFTPKQLPLVTLALLILSLLPSVDIVNKAKYSLASRGITEYVVNIELENSSNMSHLKSSAYIGATDNFFFFYDLKNKNSVVLPKSEAKWIEIKKNEKKARRTKIATNKSKPIIKKDTSNQKGAKR